MFFLDGIALAPFKGFLMIAKEVAKAVEQEREQARADAMSRLTTLHKQLETGQIDEDQFEEQESELLDLLEQLGE